MGNPYQRDINSVDREISRLKNNFRRMKWDERASFLYHHGRGAVGIRDTHANELVEYANAGADLEDRHAVDFLLTENALLGDYFSRIPSGSEKIEDPNMLRSMALQGTISYTAQKGLPDASTMWAVYRGVLAKHQLLPLAQPPRAASAKSSSGFPIGWLLVGLVLLGIALVAIL